MAVNIPAPPADATKSLETAYNYLFQLHEQLNYALSHISSEQIMMDNTTQIVSGSSQTAIPQNQTETQKRQQEFDNLRGIIVKTAKVIRSEMDAIVQTLERDYVAESEFGTYKDQTTLKLEALADGITQNYNSVNELTSDVDGFGAWKSNTDGYIKTGILWYENGVPIIGVAVGQNTQVEVDGELIIEEKNKLATFISDELAFWNNNEKIAYMTGNYLHIANAEILGTSKIGGYVVVPEEDGVAIRWEG